MRSWVEQTLRSFPEYCPTALRGFTTGLHPILYRNPAHHLHVRVLPSEQRSREWSCECPSPRNIRRSSTRSVCHGRIWSSFWAYKKFNWTLFLKFEFRIFFFSVVAIVAKSVSNFGDSRPEIGRVVSRSSIAFYISTSLIHGIASAGYAAECFWMSSSTTSQFQNK